MTKLNFFQRTKKMLKLLKGLRNILSSWKTKNTLKLLFSKCLLNDQDLEYIVGCSENE